MREAWADFGCGISDGGFEGVEPRPQRVISAFHLLPSALLLFVAPALALTPAELVGPDLRVRPVSLAGIAEGEISYFDEDRRLQREPVESFVQVRDIGGPGGGVVQESDGVAGWVLELTDGQRLVGEWLGGAEGGAGLRWKHAVLGEVAVPLEQVRGFGRGQRRVASRLGLVAADDLVRLVNGDVLHGFVSGIEGETLIIEPEGATQAVNLPLERVAEVRLSSPGSASQLPMPGECLVIFADGTRLLASDLVVSSERVALRPRLAGPGIGGIEVPLERVKRIDFVGAGWEVVDLADQEMAVTAGGEVFGVTHGPRIDRRDVLLHAPVDVDFTLPATATRLSATAELNLDGVSAATPRNWADFEVVFPQAADVAGPAEHRYRINHAHPSQAINLPIRGGKLLLRLDPAVNGPILDRLRLSDGVVLLKRDAAPADSDSATQP